MEENASNALLMAGGVLIGILIISLGVIIFQASAQFARNYEVDREQIELTSFNSQFEKYNKTDLTLQDIVTVANLAREINTANNIPLTVNTWKDSYAIKITLKSDIGDIHMESLQDRNAGTESEKANDLITKLEDDSLRMNGNEIQRYECKEIHYNENSRKVDRMIFAKKS